MHQSLLSGVVTELGLQVFQVQLDQLVLQDLLDQLEQRQLLLDQQDLLVLQDQQDQLVYCHHLVQLAMVVIMRQHQKVATMAF